jgi:hypothetical protein
MFQHRHYEALAAWLRDRPLVEPSLCRLIATSLADRLAADNQRFNRDRFLKACGVRND